MQLQASVLAGRSFVFEPRAATPVFAAAGGSVGEDFAAKIMLLDRRMLAKYSIVRVSEMTGEPARPNVKSYL
jgi:hypothetical protein